MCAVMTMPLSYLSDPERLEALQRSGLLTRRVTERMDHLAFTAARLLFADAAQINALDHAHQYTVAGWPPGEWPTMSVESSGCHTVVMTGQPLAIADTSLDTRTLGQDWSTVWRSYLGAPVLYDGQVLGSLCVLAEQPRLWQPYEITALTGIARLVGFSLEDDTSR